MEHYLNVTPDESLSGTWWDDDSTHPFCSWEYDAANGMLFVFPRGRAARVRRFPVTDEITRETLHDDLARMARMIASEGANGRADG